MQLKEGVRRQASGVRPAVVCACLLAASAVYADTSFTAKTQVYTDSDKTTVVSPVVEGTADITNNTNVSLGYLVDAVSSASVDIVTQASPITMHDTRHQVSLGLQQKLDTLTATGGYVFSKENDYLSHTINVGLADELDDKNTTLGLGYGISFNNVGRSGDENFSRSLTSQHVSASWTQLISPKLAAQVVYELGYESGYQASPYRFVPVRTSLDAAPDFWVPETDPDARWRHAIVGGLNRSVGDGGSIQGDYRFYLDDWGIQSHTFGARYFFHVGKNVEVRLRERFYVQNNASFYQPVYTMATKYITYDRELSALFSNTVGAKLSYLFTDRLEAEVKLDIFYYYYENFPPLLDRVGANIGAGIQLTY
jgi:hypothetical protein